MKNKTLTIILSTVLIACIGGSIYQLNTASALKNRLSVLTNTKNELTAEIESKTEKLKNLTSETEEMSNTISELTAKMDSLNLLAEEMQSEIKSLEEAKNIEVNSTHTDVKLGDDEYKGDNEEETTEEDTKEDLGLTQEEQDLATQIANQIMQEHPEWISGGGTGGTQQGNYEHVGTPDSGELADPNYVFGQGGDSGVAPGTVY